MIYRIFFEKSNHVRRNSAIADGVDVEEQEHTYIWTVDRSYEVGDVDSSLQRLTFSEGSDFGSN
jgi:hypothetical protein